MSAVRTSDPLWSGLGLVGPLGARASGGVPRGGVSGISIDTRTLAPGDLFFAISGDNSNGHEYVAVAFERGAAAAVVDEQHAAALAPLGPLYVVRDVLAALEGLGRAARARSAARIIAVTGSVGKTSTKEALRLVLTQAGAVHASVASYNNHWGVPLTLARMPKTARFGVIEIGMNHAGEITPLAAMTSPHIAIITTVDAVHLEHFSDVGAIADAKAEIFSGLAPGGIAIINRDIDDFGRVATQALASPAGHIATFGIHEEADARLLADELAADHSIVHARIDGETLTYRLGAPGRHLAMNSLAVLLAAKAVGLPVGDAANALVFFSAQEGRGQRMTFDAPDGPFTVIDESYNANPASMRAALALTGSLPAPQGARRIAVLGDMLELGTRGGELHAALARDITDHDIDVVFAAGPLMRGLFDALPAAVRGTWHEHAADLGPDVAAAVRSGDIVMIKGSNGSRMSTIVGALKGPSAAQAETAERGHP